MIKNKIIEDAELRSDLFLWNGPLDENQLITWLMDNDLNKKIPDDLIELWKNTGGGDFFESETILSPFGDFNLGDDLQSINDFHVDKGMSKEYLIFHTGIFTSAINIKSKTYVIIETLSYKIVTQYPNLNEWYLNGIKNELGDRYGL